MGISALYLWDSYWGLRKTTSEIAKECSVSQPYISNLMKKLGIPVRKPWKEIPELEDKQWLYEEYITDGRSTRDIAATIGCGESTITYALRRHGIPIRVPEHLQPYKCIARWPKHIPKHLDKGQHLYVDGVLGFARGGYLTRKKNIDVLVQIYLKFGTENVFMFQDLEQVGIKTSPNALRAFRLIGMLKHVKPKHTTSKKPHRLRRWKLTRTGAKVAETHIKE